MRQQNDPVFPNRRNKEEKHRETSIDNGSINRPVTELARLNAVFANYFSLLNVRRIVFLMLSGEMEVIFKWSACSFEERW